MSLFLGNECLGKNCNRGREKCLKIAKTCEEFFSISHKCPVAEDCFERRDCGMFRKQIVFCSRRLKK